MKIEEAKRKIDVIKSYLIMSGVIDKPNYKALEIASEALEKQIPKKPLGSYDGYADGLPVWDYCCPNCEKEIEWDEYTYCPECGQHIDWSEEEWTNTNRL